MTKPVLALFSILIISGCASVTTNHQFKGETPKAGQPTYEKCIVRVGMATHIAGRDLVVIGPEMNGASKFDKDLDGFIRMQLEQRQICKVIEIQEPPQHNMNSEKRGLYIDEARAAYQSETFEENALTVSYYITRTVYLDAWGIIPMMVWGAAYVGSLGIIPMGIPSGSNYWITVKMPGKQLQVSEADNSTWNWFWSPFYLKPGSTRTKKDVENVEEERLETFISHQVNAL